jgi:serine/threonine protein kinase
MGVPTLEQLRKLFPDLEIIDVLGAGGMGAVYKARQPRLNRLVALKIMVAAPGHEADFALRFEREAQVLAQLSHPHIVIIYDFGDISPERTGADPLFYFLMEYVDGTDLGQLIKSGELKSPQSLVIVPQICQALQYAHDQGITHRDIKPANILIDKKGTVKIADFGLAKMITGTEEAMMTGLTQTGTAMGTPHYMAPEQWDHPEQVDHRADIYALGVVFYEMLTGERPAGVFEPPSKKSKPPVDRKLDGVVMRAMDKNPARRYQQASQIGDDVSRISGANKRPQSTSHPAPKKSSLPLVAGLIAVLGLGGWWLWPQPEKDEAAYGRTAALPSATAPPPTTLAEPSALPARDWVKVDWPGQNILSGGKTPRQVTREEITKEGGIRLVKDDLWIGDRAPRIGQVQNGGIRLRWKQFSEKVGSFNVFMHGDGKAKVSLWGNGAAIFHGGSSDEFKLQGMPHGGLAPIGQEMLMEIACVGRLLILKRDGVLQGTLELPEAAPANFLRFQGSEVIVTQAELINLDGLSEADALKVLGVDVARESGRGDDTTGVPWENLLDDPELKSSLRPTAAGYEVNHWATVVRGPGRDGALRCRLVHDGKPNSFRLVAAKQDKGWYQAYLLPEGGMIQYVDSELPGGKFQDLPAVETSRLPAALEPGKEVELELRISGESLEFSVNGQVVCTGRDTRLGPGRWGFCNNPETPVTIRRLDFQSASSREPGAGAQPLTGLTLRTLNLEGLNEAEALKLAGVDTIAAQPRYIGRLRGAGFHIDGKPLDLKNAEGITDFVQVLLTDRGWVGLRADGRQITSEAGWGEANVARLVPGFYNSYGTINVNGQLSIRREATVGVKTIPEEVQRIGVVDALWIDGSAIALLKDGTARVWGEVYQESYRGMPIWPMPPAEALQNVKDVAAQRGMSATLTADGRLHSWGGDKEVGHFLVSPPVGGAKLEEIEPRWNCIWARDAAGLTYQVLQRQRILGTAIAKDILDIASIVALPRHATAWTWSDKERSSVQAEADALLKQIGNRPREAFDLRTVGEVDASKVAAMWIEPVAEGGAARPPAAVPSK